MYITNHAHFKIAGRMAKGEQLWKVHPIHALRRRISSISIPNLASPFELKDISPFARELLVERGFPPSTTNDEVFIVDKDNIASWLSLPCDVYQELDEILLEQEQKAPGKPRALKVNVETEDIATAVMNLQIFHALLKARLVDLVLEDKDFSTSLEGSYGYAADQRHQKITVKIPGRSVAPELEPIDEEAPVEVATESLRLPGEKHNKYVVRYLKTIVAWIEAFSWATSSRNPSVTLRPYELVLPSPPFRIEPHDRVPQFIRRLLGQLDNRITEDELELVLGPDRAKLKASNIRSAPVHAEAALMPGVACASWNTETTQDSPPIVPIEDEDTRRALRDIFAVQEVTISLSNLCCWCCWKLRNLLSELNGDDAAACPQFLLSGTHATILPWYPPPCGIRRNILEKMETELILEVEKLVRRRAYDLAPRQSSSTSVDSPPDVNEQSMRLVGFRDYTKKLAEILQEQT